MKPDQYKINSLDRALRILEELAEKGETLGVTELSRRLKVDKSMIYRLVHTLANRAFVEKDPQTKKYGLGFKVVQLAGMKLNSMKLFTVVRPCLQELTKQTGENSHLAVLSDCEVIYLDREDGPEVLNTKSGIGLQCPPHSSAVGKALLAYVSPEELAEIFRRHTLTKHTNNTIVSFAELKKHLAQVRAQGYAIDDEESYLGVRCIAAPVYDHRRVVVASLGSSGPKQRIVKERLGVVTDMVIRMAQKLSSRLGYTARSRIAV